MKESAPPHIVLLKQQKRLNVQEQNELTRHAVHSLAEFWRKNNIPTPLKTVFKAHNIDLIHMIFIAYEQDYPGTSTDLGTILTPDSQFFRFDMDLNPNRTALITLNAFENITDQYEISAHKKGIGKSFGFIAMEVLHELNQKKN